MQRRFNKVHFPKTSKLPSNGRHLRNELNWATPGYVLDCRVHQRSIQVSSDWSHFADSIHWQSSAQRQHADHSTQFLFDHRRQILQLSFDANRKKWRRRVSAFLSALWRLPLVLQIIHSRSTPMRYPETTWTKFFFQKLEIRHPIVDIGYKAVASMASSLGVNRPTTSNGHNYPKKSCQWFFEAGFVVIDISSTKFIFQNFDNRPLAISVVTTTYQLALVPD